EASPFRGYCKRKSRRTSYVCPSPAAPTALATVLDRLEVGVDHHPHEAAEVEVGDPAQDGLGPGRVAHEAVDLGRSEVPLVDHHVLTPVEPDVVEGGLAQVPDRVCQPAGH